MLKEFEVVSWKIYSSLADSMLPTTLACTPWSHSSLANEKKKACSVQNLAGPYCRTRSGSCNSSQIITETFTPIEVAKQQKSNCCYLLRLRCVVLAHDIGETQYAMCCGFSSFIKRLFKIAGWYYSFTSWSFYLYTKNVVRTIKHVRQK